MLQNMLLSLVDVTAEFQMRALDKILVGEVLNIQVIERLVSYGETSVCYIKQKCPIMDYALIPSDHLHLLFNYI